MSIEENLERSASKIWIISTLGIIRYVQILVRIAPIGIGERPGELVPETIAKSNDDKPDQYHARNQSEGVGGPGPPSGYI